MTLITPTVFSVDAGEQLERLTQIRDKLIASPATEATLSLVKDAIDDLVTALENPQASGGSVAVSNFPTTQSVSGNVAVSNFPATQSVSGDVSVANFPATQPVSGSVAVSNFPATQSVSGNVAVSNFPSTQPVSGNVVVSNLPAIQPVNGSVEVSNFPAVQAVSFATPVVISSKSVNGISDFYTRPSNTTAYTAGIKVAINESLPKNLIFTNAARVNGGSGYIVAAKLCVSGTNLANLACRLWLYNAAPIALADMAAFPLLESSFASRIGYVDFSSFVNGGTGSDCIESVGSISQSLPFTTAPDSQNLFGALMFVGSSGYTPSSAQRFRLSINVEQN